MHIKQEKSSIYKSHDNFSNQISDLTSSKTILQKL